MADLKELLPFKLGESNIDWDINVISAGVGISKILPDFNGQFTEVTATVNPFSGTADGRCAMGNNEIAVLKETGLFIYKLENDDWTAVENTNSHNGGAGSFLRHIGYLGYQYLHNEVWTPMNNRVDNFVINNGSNQVSISSVECYRSNNIFPSGDTTVQYANSTPVSLYGLNFDDALVSFKGNSPSDDSGFAVLSRRGDGETWDIQAEIVGPNEYLHAVPLTENLIAVLVFDNRSHTQFTVDGSVVIRLYHYDGAALTLINTNTVFCPFSDSDFKHVFPVDCRTIAIGSLGTYDDFTGSETVMFYRYDDIIRKFGYLTHIENSGMVAGGAQKAMPGYIIPSMTSIKTLQTASNFLSVPGNYRPRLNVIF